MRSIVEEALTKARDETVSTSQNNEDLDQILAELKTEITVIGCGGGGSNTISRMMEEGIHGAKLIAINTDAQHLIRTQCGSADPRRQAANPGSWCRIHPPDRGRGSTGKRAGDPCGCFRFRYGLYYGRSRWRYRYRCCPGCCKGCPGRRGTYHCDRHPAIFCGRCHPHGECRGRS